MPVAGAKAVRLGADAVGDAGVDTDGVVRSGGRRRRLRDHGRGRRRRRRGLGLRHPRSENGRGEHRRGSHGTAGLSRDSTDDEVLPGFDGGALGAADGGARGRRAARAARSPSSSPRGRRRPGPPSRRRRPSPGASPPAPASASVRSPGAASFPARAGGGDLRAARVGHLGGERPAGRRPAAGSRRVSLRRRIAVDRGDRLLAVAAQRPRRRASTCDDLDVDSTPSTRGFAPSSPSSTIRSFPARS